MKSYVYVTDEGRVLSYRDPWRWRWSLSVLFPLLPLLTIALADATGWRLLLWLPLLVSYGAIPLLDWLLGTDTNNPPEAVVRELEREPFYRLLTYVAVPVLVGVLVAGFWYLMNVAAGPAEMLLIVLSLGLASALSILWGIVAAGLLAIAMKLALPYLYPEIAAAPAVADSGLVNRFQVAERVLAPPPSLAPTFLEMDGRGALTLAMAPYIAIFLFMVFFDTVGTLVGVAQQAGLRRDNRLPRARQAFVSDAVGTVAGACLGTSTVTSYIESATGVEQGGRMGLTALTVAVLFLVALFGLLAAINVAGIKSGLRLMIANTIAKLVPLLLLAMVGLFTINRDYLVIVDWPGLRDFGAATLVLFFAFGGAETALNSSGEISNPIKTIPRGARRRRWRSAREKDSK